GMRRARPTGFDQRGGSAGRSRLGGGRRTAAGAQHDDERTGNHGSKQPASRFARRASSVEHGFVGLSIRRLRLVHSQSFGRSARDRGGLLSSPTTAGGLWAALSRASRETRTADPRRPARG